MAISSLKGMNKSKIVNVRVGWDFSLAREIPMAMALLQSRQDRQVLPGLSGRGDSGGVSAVLGGPHGICAFCVILCHDCGGRQSPADKLVSWEVLADPLLTGPWNTACGRTWGYQIMYNTSCYFTLLALYVHGGSLPVVLQTPEGNLRCCNLQAARDIPKSEVICGQNKGIYFWGGTEANMAFVWYFTWVDQLGRAVSPPAWQWWKFRVPLGQRRAAEKRHFLPHTSALSCSEVIRGADDQHSMVSSLIVRKVKSSAQAPLQQIQRVLQPPSVLHKGKGSSQSF